MLPLTARFSRTSWINFAIVTLIWGSTWLVIKTQLGVVPAAWSVAWRFLIGAVVMLGLCIARRKTLRLTAAQHGFAAVVAVMQFSLNFNLVYRAEQHLTSGLVALAFALLLVPNTLFAAVFLGQRTSGRFAIGSALGLIGVALLFVRDFFLPGANIGEIVLGLLMACGGVLCASIANVMQASPRGRAMPLEGGLAWALGYGGIINFGLAWAMAGSPVFDWSFSYVAGLGYLSVVASAVAFSLYYSLIRDIGPGRAAYSGVVVPVVAMGLSTVFEGYLWSPLAVLGAGMALAGLVIALRGRE